MASETDELEDYGKGDIARSGNALTKALGALTKALGGGKPMAGPPMDAPAPDDQDDGDTDDTGADDQVDGDGDDNQDGDDQGSDEPEDETEGDGDEDMEDAPRPVQKSERSAPIQSRVSNDDFLKSMLLDDDGDPTIEAEVIEVSPILRHMTDVIAKSLGDIGTELGQVRIERDADRELTKSIGAALVAIGKEVRSLRKSIKVLESQPAAEPFQGLAFGMQKSMPGGTARANRFQPLTKSQAADGIRAAYQTSIIDPAQYRNAAATLDSQGIDAALALLPEQVADVIRSRG